MFEIARSPIKHFQRGVAVATALMLAESEAAFPSTNTLPSSPLPITSLLNDIRLPPKNLYVAPSLDKEATSASNLQTNQPTAHSLKERMLQSAKVANNFVDNNFGPFGIFVKTIGAVSGLTAITLGANALAHQIHPDEIKLRETPLGTEPGVNGFVLYHIHSQRTSVGEMILPKRREGTFLRPFIAELVSPRFVSFRFAQLIARLNSRFPILAFPRESKSAVLEKAASWISETDRRKILLEEASRMHPLLSARAQTLDGKSLPPIKQTESILARIGIIFEGRTIRDGKEVVERVNHIEAPTYYKLLFMLSDLPFVFAATINHERAEQQELVLQDLDTVLEFSIQGLKENRAQIFQCLTGFDNTKRHIQEVADCLEPILLLPKTQSILYIAAVSLGLTLYQSPKDFAGKTIAELLSEARTKMQNKTSERWSHGWLLSKTITAIEKHASQANINLETLPPIDPKGELISKCASSLNSCSGTTPSIFSKNMTARKAFSLATAVKTTRARWNNVGNRESGVNNFLHLWGATPTIVERFFRACNIDPRLREGEVIVTAKVDVPSEIEWVKNANESSREIGNLYEEQRALLDLPS